MGWGFRKSFGSSAFRVNFSKSGIGFSTGVRGFRVSTNRRGTYVHMGRGGIYYRQRIGGPYRAAPQGPRSPQFDVPNPTANGLDPIYTASASQLIDDSSAAILAQINSRLKEPQYVWLVAAGVLLVAGLLTIINPIITFLAVLLGAIPITLARLSDIQRRSSPLLYELEPSAMTEWDSLNTRLTYLAANHRVWRISAQGAVYDWKRSAGANLNVQRTVVTLQRQPPPYIGTNVNPYCMSVGTQCLCFMPDRLLIYENGQYGGVDYKNLRIEIGQTNFIEEEGVQRDSKVVGSTWKYVNKSGGPDRRFNNNYQIPICSYQVIHLSSHTGLNLFLHASSHAFQGLSTGSSPEYSAQSHASRPSGGSVGGTSTGTKTKTIPQCYEVLGVAESCTHDEAIAAYRALAKHYHPDLVSHLAPEFRMLAEERMKEINVAFAELKRLRNW